MYYYRGNCRFQIVNQGNFHLTFYALVPFSTFSTK